MGLAHFFSLEPQVYEKKKPSPDIFKCLGEDKIAPN